MGRPRFASLLLAVSLALPAVGDASDAADPGVSDDRLAVGFHLSLTGMDPVMPDVVEGARLYWRWQEEELGRTIHGRTVQFNVVNDQDSPAATALACADLESSSFLIAGLTAHPDRCTAGTGETAPYFPLGAVAEARLSASAFSLGPTYERQADVIASFVARALEPEDRYGQVPIELPVVGELPIVRVPGPDGRITVGLIRPEALPTTTPSDACGRAFAGLVSTSTTSTRIGREAMRSA